MIAYQNARTANPAGSADWTRPSMWNDVNEAALCDALFAIKPSVPTTVPHKSLTKVSEWPSWLDDNTASGHCRWTKSSRRRSSAASATRRSTPVPSTSPRSRSTGRAPRASLVATSSNHAVVRDNGIAIAAAAPNYTVTLTTRRGTTGRTTITLVAESLNGRTTATFTLTAGNVAGAPPAPTSSSGLSKRRGSFRLDTTGLPA